MIIVKYNKSRNKMNKKLLFFLNIILLTSNNIFSFFDTNDEMEKCYQIQNNIKQLKAIKEGNLEKLKELVALGSNINYKDEYGYTPLIWAVKCNHKNIIEFLISKGVDREIKDNHGFNSSVNYNRTALFWAVSLQYTEIVKLLIENGAYINVKDSWGYTLLIWAVISEYFEIIEYLIDKKIDINTQDNDGRTALSHSINKNIEISKILIKHGANVNSIDKNNNSILKEAIELHSHGRLNKEIIKLLIDNGANVNHKNQYEATALFHTNDPEIARLLVDNGADIHATDNAGRTTLNWTNSEDLIHFLIKHKADINAKDHYGNTVFMNAVLHYGYKALLLLKNKSTNIFCRNKEGKNALDMASTRTLEIEIKKRINQINALKQELFNVIESGDLNNIKQLAQNISMGVYDENWNNPLHYAAFYNKPEIFNLILSIRPQLITEVNHQNKTPIETNPALNNYFYLKEILK